MTKVNLCLDLDTQAGRDAMRAHPLASVERVGAQVPPPPPPLPREPLRDVFGPNPSPEPEPSPEPDPMPQPAPPPIDARAYGPRPRDLHVLPGAGLLGAALAWEPQRGRSVAQPRRLHLPLTGVQPVRFEPALAAALARFCENRFALADLDRRTGVFAPDGRRGDDTGWTDFLGDIDRDLVLAAIAAGAWVAPAPSPVIERLLALPAAEWQRARRGAAS